MKQHKCSDKVGYSDPTLSEHFFYFVFTTLKGGVWLKVLRIYIIIDQISCIIVEIILFYYSICRNISIFAPSNYDFVMKYKEFHRQITRAGWKFDHAEGSHYFYIKDGILSEPVPFHGAKEIPEPLRRKIARALGL